MAANLLESLVLRGVSQAKALVADMVRMGSNQVKGRTPANLSYLRHPSPRFQTNHPCDVWLCADDLGDKTAARRAGRPGSSVGVPVSREPARLAGRTVLSGWSAVPADAMANAVKPFGM